VVRTPNHDAFGLAILIFHLLFMGRHPFAGRFLGPGDMPIERAISEHRFAYGRDTARSQMQPPPNTLPLLATTPEIAAFFERAFAPGAARDGTRPRAPDWIAALHGLEHSLQRCSVNAAHHYAGQLAGCPWCAIEGATGVVLFGLLVQHRGQPGTFNLAAVWAEIRAVSPPGPAPVLPNAASTPTPFSEALAALRARRIKIAGAIGVFLASLVIAFSGAVVGLELVVVVAGIAGAR
jgi:DNA-binding helix-hairpin-helix protein with protein kinase domain